MAEPTSVLTFSDLLIEVSRKMGVAYYGADGLGVAQVPTDAHDLDECKRHVNNAIRMFIADGPKPNGWHWTRPVADVTIWGTVDTDATNTVSGGTFATPITPLTAQSASFYPTMEGKTITVGGVAYEIDSYVSPTVVNVTGDASSVSAETWTITSDGYFTLPLNFSGQYSGDITYAASTNQGVGIQWNNESTIRAWRQDIQSSSGDPYWAAIRPRADLIGDDLRRRWELSVYPTPDDVLVLNFPYHIYFTSLVALTEVQPAPFVHDETIKAACFAVVEKDVGGQQAADWTYYTRTCLPNSYRMDGLSAPKRLGYFGNGSSGLGDISQFRSELYDRPTVPFNT